MSIFFVEEGFDIFVVELFGSRCFSMRIARKFSIIWEKKIVEKDLP